MRGREEIGKQTEGETSWKFEEQMSITTGCGYNNADDASDSDGDGDVADDNNLSGCQMTMMMLPSSDNYHIMLMMVF